MVIGNGRQWKATYGLDRGNMNDWNYDIGAMLTLLTISDL
jgi:hypothetical protein